MQNRQIAEARPWAQRTRFPGISSRAYEHPAAQTALAAMKGVRGFDTVLKKMHGAVGDPYVRMQYLSSAVRVGPRQFKRLHEIKAEAASILDMPNPPELYVQTMGMVNALTVGLDRPFIVVSTELLDVVNDDELAFVIGHELGHALSGHAVYRTMANLLTNIDLSAFFIAGLAMEGIEAGLQEWSRKCELSCDRAGLLVVQDVDVSTRALMKLTAGTHVDEMDPHEFLEQAAEFELDTSGVRSKVIKYLLASSGTHPILVIRAAQLDRWVRQGGYAKIMELGQYPRREDDRSGGMVQSIKEQRRSAKADRALRREDKEQRTQRMPGPRDGDDEQN